MPGSHGASATTPRTDACPAARNAARPPIECPTSTTGTGPYRAAMAASANSTSATGSACPSFPAPAAVSHLADREAGTERGERTDERLHAPDRELIGPHRVEALGLAAVQHEDGNPRPVVPVREVEVGLCGHFGHVTLSRLEPRARGSAHGPTRPTR